MDKYVKKPVVIEAVPLRLWHDEEGVHGNYSEIMEWIGLIGIDQPDGSVAVYKPVIDFKHVSRERTDRVSELCLIIPTLEGMMEASDGDFIIKGVQGEFYPCKPDIFELTYQKVEND